MLIQFDPQNMFDQDVEVLRDACGILPMWIYEAFKEESLEPFEYLSGCYGFGTYNMSDEVTVTEDGTWQYPEDPDLTPLCKAEFESYDGIEHTFYIYQYGLVSYLREGVLEQAVRMD